MMKSDPNLHIRVGEILHCLPAFMSKLTSKPVTEGLRAFPIRNTVSVRFKEIHMCQSEMKVRSDSTAHTQLVQFE